jgi:hypothetical protein
MVLRFIDIVCQWSTPDNGVVLLWMDVSQCVSSFTHYLHLGCFLLLIITNKAAMNTCVLSLLFYYHIIIVLGDIYQNSYIIVEFTPSIILLYSPYPHLQNSFNRSHFSIYIREYIMFP